MNITRASREDVPEIYRLYSEEMNQGHGFEPTPLYELDDFYDYLKDPRVIILVSKEEKNLAGFIISYDLLDWAYMDVVCVAKNFRGKNIGGRLIDELFKINPKLESIEACYYSDDVIMENFFKKNKIEFNRKPMIWVVKVNKNLLKP